MPALANSPLARLSPHEQQVLANWIAFIESGFELAAFTPRLYQHLVDYASFDAHGGMDAFWRDYFSEDAYDFRIFINQFGGDLEVAEHHSLEVDPWWLYPSLKDNRADLNLAMIEVMRQLYAPVMDTFDVLIEQDYELYKEEELMDQWQQMLGDGDLPPDADTSATLSTSLELFLERQGDHYDACMFGETIDYLKVSHLIRDAIARAVSKSGWRGPRIAALRPVPHQTAALQQDLFVLYHWRKQSQGGQKNQSDSKSDSKSDRQQNAARRRLSARTLPDRRRRLAAEARHPIQRKERLYDKIKLTTSQ